MTDHHEASRRRYIKGELDQVGTPPDGIIRAKFHGFSATKYLNITNAQFEAIEKILLPEPESPVTHDPCIQGTIEIEGRTSEFLLPLDRDDVGFSQWGADNTVLWERVALLDNLSGTAKEWWRDQGDGLTGFTVSGYWANDDTRLVTAVIEGEHEVTGGGDDLPEGGPFAVYVRAENAAAAEEMVNGTDESEEFDE